MRKILLFLTLLVTSLSVNAQCDYTFRMFDDFDDGWDGSQMIVVQNSVTIATLTGPVEGGPDDVVVAMAPDTPFELIWNVAGSWTNEKQIQILDQNNVVIYEMPFGSGALAGTTLFSGVSCPSCAPPSALLNTALTATDASFSWTAASPAPAGGYDFEVRTSGAPGSGPAGLVDSDNVAGTTASVSGLTGGTSYTFYVRSNCSGSESSWINIPFSFVLGNNCLTAIDLGGETSPLSASTSAAGVTNDFSFCTMGSARDLIYFIDVPDGFTLTIGQTVNAYDSRHTLRFGGACPGTTEVVCTDDPDTQTVEWTNTTGSTQRAYWVNSGFGTGAGTFTLAWSLTPPPACPDVTNLSVVVTSTSNADISWTAAAGATNYLWEIQPLGTPQGTAGAIASGSGAATSVSASGAYVASTQYTLYVVSDCGGALGNYQSLNFTANIPPANNSCANAVVLNSCSGGAQTLSGTTINSTIDAEYQNCGAGGDNTTQRGVWYIYNGDDNEVTINTCGPGYDTRLTVFSGSCGAFTCIGANDDMGLAACATSGVRSEVSFNALSGTTYYVYVHGFGTPSATGNFVLNWTCAPLCLPVPANEVCASAATLTVQADPANTTAGFNSCASIAVQNPSCVSPFSSFNDVWYEFVATDANHDVRLTFDAPVSLGLALYTGACGTADLGCIPPGTLLSGEDILLSGLTVGETYRLQVLSAAAGVGSFEIVVWENPCPFPTAFAANAITATSANISWTENGGASTWDLFYGPTPLTAPDDLTTPTESGVSPNNPYPLTGLAPQTQYALYVRSVCNSVWSGPLTFTTLALPPANDNCDNAIPLTVNADLDCGVVTAGTTAGATPSPQATTGLSGTANNDVWFSFTATSNAHRISLLNRVNIGGGTSTSIDMGMGLYNATGGCLALTFVGTSDPETWNVTGLTPGTTYLVRVYGWFGSIQNVNFNICVGTTPPPPPNNLCANAIMVGARSVTPGTNSAANNVGAGPFCGTTPGSAGVWYTVVGTGGQMIASTCTGSNFDTKLNVYTGSCGAFTCVGGNDDACGTQSRVTFNSVQGQLYYIYVTGFGTASGNFTLTMESACATTATLPAPEYRQYCNPQTELLGVELNGFVESYQWLQNGSPVSGATSSELLLNRWSLGNYRVAVTCDANTFTSANSVTVNRVTVLNEAGQNAHYGKVCLNESTTFSAPELAGATYEWRVRPTGAIVSTDREYTFSGFSGSFDVFVTSASGCTKSTRVRVLPQKESNCSPTGGKPAGEELAGKTGTESVSGDVVLNFYPNPVSQVYKITLNGLAQDEMFTVSWFDLTGKEVSRATQISTGTGTQAELSVNNLASGMYMVQVNNANHNFTFKVMVQK